MSAACDYSQDHYDFGMRAVKSVLVMAGGLKRANPDLPEDVVLIRAMRDSNLPKFLVHDKELFCNIIADLFPGIDVPNQVGACLLSRAVVTMPCCRHYSLVALCWETDHHTVCYMSAGLR